MRSWFEWVGAMESSVALRESLNAYPIMLTSHVIGMCMFAGLIMMMDLRLAGVGNLNSSITQVQGRLFPWQMVGFAISIVTGLLLLFSDPMRFYTNFYFWTKNVLLILAGLNMWYFHATTYQTVDQWGQRSVASVRGQVRRGNVDRFLVCGHRCGPDDRLSGSRAAVVA